MNARQWHASRSYWQQQSVIPQGVVVEQLNSPCMQPTGDDQGEGEEEERGKGKGGKEEKGSQNAQAEARLPEWEQMAE